VQMHGYEPDAMPATHLRQPASAVISIFIDDHY
jgi:hypothetical protein